MDFGWRQHWAANVDNVLKCLWCQDKNHIWNMILYEEILREFQRQKVKYVLVGGIAINLHGYFRGTADMDILVEMSDGNLKKVVSILKEKGYRVKQPVDPMGIANEKLRHDWIHNKHMKAFNFYKEDELKEVDIIIESLVSYEEAKKDALKFKIEDITLPVISIDNLIKMKKNTGRSVDKFDIEELKKIKNLNPVRNTNATRIKNKISNGVKRIR